MRMASSSPRSASDRGACPRTSPAPRSGSCARTGSVYRGTPVRLWFDTQLAEIFGVTVRPSAETADQIYDQIATCLASPEFTPRALYDRFNIEVLATTDDPCDDLPPTST